MSNQEKYVMINEDEFNSHANARALLEKGMPMMVLKCFIEIRRKFRKESTTLTRIKWTSARRLSWRQFRAFFSWNRSTTRIRLTTWTCICLRIAFGATSNDFCGRIKWARFKSNPFTRAEPWSWHGKTSSKRTNSIKNVLINRIRKCDRMIDYVHINMLNFWL